MIRLDGVSDRPQLVVPAHDGEQLCARVRAHTRTHTHTRAHTRARAHARTPHALLGFVYIFDPESGCADKLDVGENAYAMVLADDVTGYPLSATEGAH